MPTLTAEQSKLGAIRSAEVRRANAVELEMLRARVKEFESAQPAIVPTEHYIIARLVRVRKQIDLLSAMLEEEQDPNKIDRLASAIAKLSELERQLSGRPLPGSLKPSSPKQSRSLPPVQPVALPTPVEPSAPAQ